MWKSLKVQALSREVDTVTKAAQDFWLENPAEYGSAGGKQKRLAKGSWSRETWKEVILEKATKS